MKSTPERDEWLRERLTLAVETFAGKSADAFGRLLGYTNGGYIRECMDGKKPVRGAIIDRANGVSEKDAPGLRGWFDEPGGAPAGSPRTFSDLDGVEGQLVMHLRWLTQRAGADGGDWPGRLMQLVADIVAIPDERRDAALNGAIAAVADARYSTLAKAKDVSRGVGADLPPSPSRHAAPRKEPTGARQPTSRRTVR